MNEEVKHWNEFEKEFHDESDRAVVVLAAAKLDEYLRIVISKRLISTTKSSQEDDLLGSNRPISTFSSRIELAYRIGLIDSKTSRTLNLIRRLRNDFAHGPPGMSLNLSPGADRIREMFGDFDDLFQEVNDDISLRSDSRGKFEFVVFALITFLDGLVDEIEELKNISSISDVNLS